MTRSHAASLLAIITVFTGLTTSALGQSTAFTYQGRLNDANQPASGLHDFRFRLFDAATGGAQVGATQCVDNLQVDAGTFTATIDFGQQFATTATRFIEVDVRRDTGLNCSNGTGFTTLTPRQAITPAPRATQAQSAFSLAAPDGSHPTAVFVDNNGRLGVGTQTPTHTVHIANAEPTIALQDTDGAGGTGGTQVGYVSYRDSANAERAWVGYGSAGSAEFTIFNARPLGDLAFWTTRDMQFVTNNIERMRFDSTRNMTIGTPVNPIFLSLRGDENIAGGLFVQSAIQIGTGDPTIADLYVSSPNVIGGGLGVFSEIGRPDATFTTAVRAEIHTSDINSEALYAVGRFRATGTKSFCIDHPDDPTNRYLLHYCAESPEVINFYRGSVTLDANGAAVVTLPPYFAKINTQPTYQLTPVGAAMPSLHVAQRINAQALAAGAAAAPETPAPPVWFTIAGGVPGGEVCWRVDAVRNDRWVQVCGAPVELDKPPQERGTYQHPEIYGQPQSLSASSRLKKPSVKAP